MTVSENFSDSSLSFNPFLIQKAHSKAMTTLEKNWSIAPSAHNPFKAINLKPIAFQKAKGVFRALNTFIYTNCMSCQDSKLDPATLSAEAAVDVRLFV